MPKIRLLVVDSSNIFCDGLINLINSKPSINIVPMSSTPPQAVKEAITYEPHVVLIDIDPAKESDIELAQRIHETVPDAHILIFSQFRENPHFFSAFSAGITGYISKNNSFENIIRAVKLAAQGTVIIDLPVAKAVIWAIQTLSSFKHGAMMEYYDRLTKQEVKVLTLIAHGKSNKDIAESLFSTEDTVKVHVHNILKKLEARNRMELIIYAIERGMQYSRGSFKLK